MKIRDASRLISATGEELIPASSEAEGDVSISVGQIAAHTLDRKQVGSADPVDISGFLVRRADGTYLFLTPAAIGAIVAAGTVPSESSVHGGEVVLTKGNSSMSGITVSGIYDFIRRKMSGGAIAFDGATSVVEVPESGSVLGKKDDGASVSIPIDTLIDKIVKQYDAHLVGASPALTPSDKASLVLTDAGVIRSYPLSTLLKETDSVRKTGTVVADHVAVWTPSGRLANGPSVVSDLSGDDDGCIPNVGAVRSAFGARVHHELIPVGEISVSQDVSSVLFRMPDGWDGDASTVRLRFHLCGDGVSTDGTCTIVVSVSDLSFAILHSSTIAFKTSGSSTVSVLSPALSGIYSAGGLYRLNLLRASDLYAGSVTLEAVELECVTTLAGGEAWK